MSNAIRKLEKEFEPSGDEDEEGWVIQDLDEWMSISGKQRAPTQPQAWDPSYFQIRVVHEPVENPVQRNYFDVDTEKGVIKTHPTESPVRSEPTCTVTNVLDRFISSFNVSQGSGVLKKDTCTGGRGRGRRGRPPGARGPKKFTAHDPRDLLQRESFKSSHCDRSRAYKRRTTGRQLGKPSHRHYLGAHV